MEYYTFETVDVNWRVVGVWSIALIDHNEHLAATDYVHCACVGVAHAYLFNDVWPMCVVLSSSLSPICTSSKKNSHNYRDALWWSDYFELSL